MGFSYFHRFRQHHGHHGSSNANTNTNFYNNFLELDPVFIQQEWNYRRSNASLELVAGCLNAMAWMMFCIPLCQVAWIQQQKQQQQHRGGAATGRINNHNNNHNNNNNIRLLGVHVAVAVLAVGGSITELIARLMFIGTTSVGNWLAKDFNLDTWTTDGNAQQGNEDMIGWRTLEMIHLMTRGLVLWIDAAEWLFLSAIFTLLYVSVFSTVGSPFTRSWARLGLAIAALAFVDFSSEVLRLKSWMTFSFVSIIISYVSRLLCMPIWLLWLGRQLHRIGQQRNEEESKSSSSSPMDDNHKTVVTGGGGGAQEMNHYGDDEPVVHGGAEEDEDDTMAGVFS